MCQNPRVSSLLPSNVFFKFSLCSYLNPLKNLNPSWSCLFLLFTSRWLYIIACRLLLILVPRHWEALSLCTLLRARFLGIFFRILLVIIFRAMLVLCLVWICCSLCLVLLSFFRRSSLCPFAIRLDSTTSPGKCACVYLLSSLVAKTPSQKHSQRWGCSVGTWSKSHPQEPLAPQATLSTAAHPPVSTFWSLDLWGDTYVQPTGPRMHCSWGTSSFCQEGPPQSSQSDSPQNKKMAPTAGS